MFNQKFKRSLILLLSFLLIFTSIVFNDSESFAQIAKPSYKKVRDLKVHYIDVGQGDSIFIELPDGKNALIDGGPTYAANKVITYIKQTRNNKIDYLFATHPHEDHIGGLPTVINTFEVDKIYMPDKAHTTKTFEYLLTTIQSKGKTIIPTNHNTVVFDMPGLALKAFGPVDAQKASNLNNSSIVLKLHHKKHNFLFTGDIEAEAERQLINSGKNLNVNVLKVAHHGSNTSTTQAFLDNVKPSYGVISLGANNQYNHPHNDIVNRLKSNNVQILRTDQDGDITFTSDGNNLTVAKNGVVIKRDTPTVKKPVIKPKPKPVVKPKPKPAPVVKPKAQVGTKVLVTPTGKRYHARKCGRGNYSWTTLQKARARGLTPCKKCY